MGLSIWELLKPAKNKSGTVQNRKVDCSELFNIGTELQIRELCFWVCVNYLAGVITNCEIKTYKDGKEIKGNEYWLWNIEPNPNQNAAAFRQKLVAKLCTDNEALIISSSRRDGREARTIADSYTIPHNYPLKQNEYTDVTVGEVTYDKTFREKDVMRIIWKPKNIKPVIDGLYNTYWRLVYVAMQDYSWAHGQHWKVHVDQIAEGSENFEKDFRDMINEQVKPFLESTSAVLPEFDGYKFENAGNEANGRGASASSPEDINKLVAEILTFTAQGFGIPTVLINGTVQDTKEANRQFLSLTVDPLAKAWAQEGNRKIYGFDEWSTGNYMKVDTSAVMHFDLFDAAAAVEKLIGSGAYSINDVRAAAGQEKINEPWADQHFLTKNIGEVQITP